MEVASVVAAGFDLQRTLVPELVAVEMETDSARKVGPYLEYFGSSVLLAGCASG